MDLTRSPLGLWLPEGSLVDTSDDGLDLAHPELEFFLLVMESRFATDTEPSMEEVCNLLSGYSLEAVVATVARINLVLEKADSREDMVKVQALLARKIFKADRARAIFEEAIRQDPKIDWNHRGVFFNERQTLNLLKLACLIELPEKDEEQDLVRLGEALLMLSSLMDSGVSRETNANTAEEGSSKLERYIFANSIFFRGHPMLADLARAETLFLERGRYEGSGFDPEDRLQKVLGVEPRRFMWALRMMHAFYYTISNERLDENAVSISCARAFSDEFKLTEAESCELVDSACWPIDELRERIQNDYSLEDLKFYDALPFAERPLVRFDDRVYCMSTHLLQLLAGMNLQYRFLDSNAFSAAERKLFLDYKGTLFEDYIYEVLVRMFGEDRVFREEHLRGSAGAEKVCDFGIDYGRALILIETKATLVPIAAKFALDQTAYEDRVIGTLVQATTQLSDTINRIEGGHNSYLPPERIEKYCPIVVTLELMHAPMTVRTVRRVAGAESLFNSLKVLDFIVADVSDIELLENAATAGENVLELLERKQSETAYRDVPVANYIRKRDYSWSRKNNPELARKFREVQAALEETTRALDKPQSSGTEK